MLKTFVLGLITGATATWVLKDRVATGIDRRTRSIRTTAALRLRAAADAIERGVTGARSALEPPSRIARAS